MTGKAKKIWMNGKLVPWKDANVHVLTHALNYGTAIFEGIRCYDTPRGPAIFRLKDHLRRMQEGIKSYEFRYVLSIEKMSSVIKNLIIINKLKSCYIRPIVYVSTVGIGLDTSGASYGFAVAALPFGKYYGTKAEKGISTMISSWRRIKATILSPHVKASANYMNSVLAKCEAHEEGFDEAIMLNDEGFVSEATGENIFIVKDGVLHTPPLHDAVLAGITRDSLMKVARDLDIRVAERSLLRDELYTADEVFLCGTAAEITPVRQVDHRKISDGAGPVTRKLKDYYFNIVNGLDERYSGWLEYVRRCK